MEKELVCQEQHTVQNLASNGSSHFIDWLNSLDQFHPPQAPLQLFNQPIISNSILSAPSLDFFIGPKRLLSHRQTAVLGRIQIILLVRSVMSSVVGGEFFRFVFNVLESFSTFFRNPRLERLHLSARSSFLLQLFFGQVTNPPVPISEPLGNCHAALVPIWKRNVTLGIS
jgi:hypothetical protein